MSTAALASQAPGYRNIWFTLTFKNDARIVRKAIQSHYQLVADMTSVSDTGDFETQAYFQPFPSSIARHGVDKGGNVLGIDSLKSIAFVFLGSLAVHGERQEGIGRRKMRAWREALERYSKSVGADVRWRYINYADAEQDVLRSYGEENVGRMRKVSRKHDPQGIFQSRVPGGFKIPR